MIFVWTELAPPLTAAAGAYSSAVDERVVARRCASSRLPASPWPASTSAPSASTGAWPGTCPSRPADPGDIPEEFYDAAESGATGAASPEEPLAAEFAERYATDHLGMDEAFWDRLHLAFSDDELVDLALCVGSWLALGRFNQVFDIDGACRVPSPGPR